MESKQEIQAEGVAAAATPEKAGAPVVDKPLNEDVKKRSAPDSSSPDEPDAKKQKVEKTPTLIRQQIEYYLSDPNMKRDRFFHSKISENPEGWLEIKHVLSCKKIQSMGATQADVIGALGDSHLETKVDGSDVAWIRRTTPLPELDVTEMRGGNNKGGMGRNQRGGRNERPARSLPKAVRDIHTYGCLVKVSQIPEEVSWTKVKEALGDVLQKEIGTPTEGKHPNRLRYVSPVNPDGESLVYCRNFPNDKSIIAKVASLEVNGLNLPVELVEDLQTAVSFFDKSLPPPIKKDREREHMKMRTDMVSRPLMVGGTKFESVEHLKKCYRELLDMTQIDAELKPTAFKVIRALLDYHPNAAVKANDVVSIKVSERTDLDQPTKCFFLVRGDGTSEDFSMIKCIDSLMQNPPFINEEENKTLAKSETEISPEGKSNQDDVATTSSTSTGTTADVQE